MKRYFYLIIIFTFFLTCPKGIFALSECNYISDNKQELKLAVASDSSGYYFTNETYGFSSTDTSLSNGKCPNSVIRIPSGVICAVGFTYSDSTHAAATCNGSSYTGTRFYLKTNESSPIASKNVTIYVDDVKTNVTGKLIDSRTYVSITELCNALGCSYKYKTEGNNEYIIITTDMSNYSKEFSTFYFEIEYNIKTEKYISYINIGDSKNKINRFKLKELDEAPSILDGNANSLGSSNGDLLVPIRFVANGLGREVTWDGNTNTAYINVVPPDYSHVLTDNSTFTLGETISSNSIYSNPVNIKSSNCLFAVAVDSNNKVLKYSTAISFYNEDTSTRTNKIYKFQSRVYYSDSNTYIGISDSVCALGKTIGSGTIVAISVKNFFPNISIHNLNTTETTVTEQKKEIQTIINVPIDSRPVSRSNFEPLVSAMGYSYHEITSGLDTGTSTSADGAWGNGNSSNIRKSTAGLLNVYGGKNTTAIINLSSYMYGGLGGTRSPDNYTDAKIKTAINDLKTLVNNNPNTKFYINYVIPRNQPDNRVYKWGNGSIKDTKGIKYYSDGKTLTTFSAALFEWYYLYYVKQSGNWNNVPDSVKQFYDDFYNENYNTSSYMKAYLNMYEKTVDIILKELAPLSKKSNVEVVILVDDYEVPDSIKGLSWVEKDHSGNEVKYSTSKYVLDNISNVINNNSSITRLYGTDEVNHVVLGREINRINGTKVSVNANYYSEFDPNFASYVGPYDRGSLSQIINSVVNFSNGASTNSNNTINIDGYFVKNYTNYSKITNEVYSKINNDSNSNIMIVSFIENSKDEESVKGLLKDLIKNKNIFTLATYGGWNTYANAVGIQIARNIVYDSLKNDVNACIDSGECTSSKVTKELEERIMNYDKTRIIGILEDGIYNSYANKNISNLTSDVIYESIDDRIYEQRFKIGKYSYSYSNAAINATNPWGRTFEPKLVVSLVR